MEVTRQLAEFASGLQVDDLPGIVVERAKLAILDTIGVTIAGSQHQAVNLVADLVGAGGTDGPATVIARDRRMTPSVAAFINGCSAHVLDYDDGGHSSAHTLPATLAAAEEVDQSGATLLASFVAGREVRMRLNRAIDTGRFELEGRGPGSRGWHAAGTLGSIGSAAGAARALGLGPDQTAVAMGIAASLASGIISNFGTMTKCVHIGNAARNGVESASLASRGFTADTTVLTSVKGFVEAMCLAGECDPGDIVAGIGTGYLLAEDGNRIKPYPSCTGTHRYIGAVRAMVAEHGLSLTDVDRIRCTARPSLVCPHPTTDLECKFSAPFAIVATLIDGSITLENCTEAFLRTPLVQDLLARTQELPQESPSWVEICTRDGMEYRKTLGAAPSLNTKDEVIDKFHVCADPLMGRYAAEAVVEAVMDIERIPSVRTLGRLLLSSTAN